MIKNLYMVVHKTGYPVQSISTEHMIFGKLSEAKRELSAMKDRGEKHVYGYDTFFVKDLRIKKIQYEC